MPSVSFSHKLLVVPRLDQSLTPTYNYIHIYIYIFIYLFIETSFDRADDWDLANPLQTCTLTVERRDHRLILRLMALHPNENGPPGATVPVLFAQSNIQITPDLPMTHFCDAVIDSSRYFCVKIVDPSQGRSAHIGLGFRERDDASNFRMALQDYERSLQRERTAEEMQAKYKHNDDNDDNYNNNDDDSQGKHPFALQQGEKIRVQIKGRPTKEKQTKQTTLTLAAAASNVPLLRIPPPPSAIPPAISGSDLDMVEKTHTASLSYDNEEDEKTVDSADAVGDGITIDDDNEEDDLDDEWNDFQGSEPKTEG